MENGAIKSVVNPEKLLTMAQPKIRSVSVIPSSSLMHESAGWQQQKQE